MEAADATCNVCCTKKKSWKILCRSGVFKPLPRCSKRGQSYRYLIDKTRISQAGFYPFLLPPTGFNEAFANFNSSITRFPALARASGNPYELVTPATSGTPSLATSLRLTLTQISCFLGFLTASNYHHVSSTILTAIHTNAERNLP